MRKNPYALVVVLLGICALTRPSWAKENVQQVQNLSVIDGRGKRVGAVLGFYVTNTGGETGGAATVALRVENETVILYVRPAGFAGAEHGFTKRGGTLYFESANCTGPAYQNAQNLVSPLIGPHMITGTKLYAFNGDPKNIIVRSVQEAPSDVCRPIDPEEALGQPLRFLIDLAEEFTPPFSLKAAP